MREACVNRVPACVILVGGAIRVSMTSNASTTVPDMEFVPTRPAFAIRDSHRVIAVYQLLFVQLAVPVMESAQIHLALVRLDGQEKTVRNCHVQVVVHLEVFARVMALASAMQDILEAPVRFPCAHPGARVMELVRTTERVCVTRTLRAQTVPYLLIATEGENASVDFAIAKRDTEEKSARLICVQTAEFTKMEITPSRYRSARVMDFVLRWVAFAMKDGVG